MQSVGHPFLGFCSGHNLGGPGIGIHTQHRVGLGNSLPCSLPSLPAKKDLHMDNGLNVVVMKLFSKQELCIM